MQACRKDTSIVHHGGCGTVAAVLRAGIPSVVLPQSVPQEHFGALLARENLATGVLDVDTIRPQDLAAALRATASNTAVRRGAQAWRNTVSAEPGIRAAADFIEDHHNEVRHCASPPVR